jgi:hypothetical protein
MKTTLSIIILLASLSGCKKCYECRIMEKTETQYGTTGSNVTLVTKCDMTARQIRKFEEDTEGSISFVAFGNNYTSTTQVQCK